LDVCCNARWSFTSPASRAAGASLLRRQTQTSLEGWGPKRSLYGYSMSTRIKSNQLARGPDPRLDCRGPGNLRRRGPCVQPLTSVFKPQRPKCASWPLASLRMSQIGLWFAGARLLFKEARPVDLRQLVLSLLSRTLTRFGRVRGLPLLASRALGGRQLPG